jgi:hypothetical protein
VLSNKRIVRTKGNIVYLPVYHVMFINADGLAGQNEQELLF